MILTWTLTVPEPVTSLWAPWEEKRGRFWRAEHTVRAGLEATPSTSWGGMGGPERLSNLWEVTQHWGQGLATAAWVSLFSPKEGGELPNGPHLATLPSLMLCPNPTSRAGVSSAYGGSTCPSEGGRSVGGAETRTSGLSVPEAILGSRGRAGLEGHKLPPGTALATPAGGRGPFRCCVPGAKYSLSLKKPEPPGSPPFMPQFLGPVIMKMQQETSLQFRQTGPKPAGLA